MFKVTYNNQDTFNNATVENNYTQANIELDVVKADKNSDEKLSGAVFTLKEIDETKVPTEGGIPVYKQDDNGIISRDSAPTVKETGLTKYDNLTAGYYEITESKAPDGYIKSKDTAIYFKVQRGEVIWLTKDAAKQLSQWAAVPADNENEWITFVQADATLETNATFIVNNEPGAALPNTGGAGTSLHYLLGIMLTAFAGAGLVMRRRRRGDYA